MLIPGNLGLLIVAWISGRAGCRSLEQVPGSLEAVQGLLGWLGQLPGGLLTTGAGTWLKLEADADFSVALAARI